MLGIWILEDTKQPQGTPNENPNNMASSPPWRLVRGRERETERDEEKHSLEA